MYTLTFVRTIVKTIIGCSVPEVYAETSTIITNATNAGVSKHPDEFPVVVKYRECLVEPPVISPSQSRHVDNQYLCAVYCTSKIIHVLSCNVKTYHAVSKEKMQC
jgi:hypothetical protein